MTMPGSSLKFPGRGADVHSPIPGLIQIFKLFLKFAFTQLVIRNAWRDRWDYHIRLGGYRADGGF